MNIQRYIKGILPKLAKTVITNIRNQINAGTFSHGPFGAPLQDRTIARRQNKKHNALYDTGAFSKGLRYDIGSKDATVYSTGKSVKQQEGFILGYAKGVPERDPFVKFLPVARSNLNIEEHIVKLAGIDILRYVDKEISKIKGVT